ncbi:hypothetical protein ScPMuIL_005415 [Solemya velum]
MKQSIGSNYVVEVRDILESQQSLIKSKILLQEKENKEDAFVVIDLGDIVHKYDNWVRKLPRVKPFYAVKCNNDHAVLKILADLGTGFDCASQTEIQKVLNLDVDPARIIYANTVKQTSFLNYSADKNVRTMTFDNEAELHKIKAVFPGARLVLRILPGHFKVAIELGNKFGCHPKRVSNLLAIAKSLTLNVVGVSFHVGSGCREAEAYAVSIEKAREAFDLACDLGFKMELLDIGGGYPGHETGPGEVSFEEMADVINSSLEKYFPEKEGVKVIAEPGRYFARSAMSIAVNIIGKRVVPNNQRSEAGEKGEELSRTWSLSPDELRTPNNVWDKFQQSVGIADNFRVHRLNLIGYKQTERCRALALKCKFNDIDARLIDQLIVGTHLTESCKELIQEDHTLTIDDALHKCRAHDASEAHMKAFKNAGAAGTKIDAIFKKNDRKPNSRNKGILIRDCIYCGKDHPVGKCPSYHDKCSQCGKMGHWRHRCEIVSSYKENNQSKVKSGRNYSSRNVKSKQRGSQEKYRDRKKKSVHTVDVGSDVDREEFSFDVIKSNAKQTCSGNDITTDLNVKIPGYSDTAKMTCKIDTGAQGNILPIRVVRKILPSLTNKSGVVYGDVIKKRPNVKLYAYNGREITQYGSVNLELRYGHGWMKTDFFIADTPGPIILGKTSSLALNIITVNTVAEMTLHVNE